MKENKENYEHLEGKVIDYVLYSGDIEKVLVVGIEKDFGITIVSADSKREYICINGPNSPKKSYASSMSAFYAMFNYLVKGIKKGSPHLVRTPERLEHRTGQS